MTKSTILSPNYTIPYSYNYNTDCDTTAFNVIAREARPGQTELRHIGTCAVHTYRGLTDGDYLDAGVPAGRFSRLVERIPGSKTLLAFNTIINSVSIQALFYDGIVPNYNSSTGEVTYQLTGPHKLTDQAGNEYLLRPGSIAYDSTGQWMIAESFKGYVRVNLATREATPFAPTTSPQNGVGQDQHVAISSNGRYAAIAVSNFFFRIYDLNTCGSVPAAPTGPVSCQYKDIAPFLASTFSDYKISVYVRFASPELLTFIVAHTAQLGHIERLSVRMAPSGQAIEDTNYLALGDSFSSGEGTFSYQPGTDSRSPQNKCHLGINSYPYLVARTLYANSNFHSVACSGATMSNYFSDPQYNDVPGSPLGKWLPGATTQQAYLRSATNPSAITLSMVGNDIGFKSKITHCVSGTDSCYHFREERQSVAVEIKSKFDQLVTLYQSVRSDSGGARIYVLGYPQLFDANTPDNKCGNNVWVDAEERAFSRSLVTYLNAVIRAATEKAGVQYIDTENSFEGHQLCDSAQKAVNGMTKGDDAFIPTIGPIGNESFHPNVLGNGLMGEALLRQSLDLNKEMPPAQTNQTAPADGSPAYLGLIGNAPTGGVFSKAVYTTLEGAELIDKTKKFVPVVGDIPLRPSSLFQAWFNSTPTYLGSLATDANGNLSGELTIPSTLPSGYHTLHIYGQSLAGENIDIYKAIYVAASENDIDGDGIPNEQEKCLAVEPANIDYDRDGIDDACDPEVTEPPADATPPTITYTVSPAANSNGWYQGDATITFSCLDDMSGIESCSNPVTVSTEGKDQPIVGTATDKAGNTATVTAIVNLDTTGPAVTYMTSVAPNENGWHKSDVVVSFSCIDGLSGVTSCPSQHTFSEDGASQTVLASSMDKAGNTSSLRTVLINIDKTAPSISYSLSSPPNTNGQHNKAVTVTFHCADIISGVQSCSSPVTLTTDGANQVVIGTATDNAGNVSSVAVSVNIDSTEPVISNPTIKGALINVKPASIGQKFTISASTSDMLSGVLNGEYYVDVDPGLGRAKPMALSGSNLSATTDFPGLTIGSHKLYVRAQDKAGNYSQPAVIGFFYSGPVILTSY